MTTVYLQQLGLVCALGSGTHAVRGALLNPTRPDCLTVTDHYSPGRPLHVGLVARQLPDLCHLPRAFQSRNNAMAWHALEQIRPAVNDAIGRHGADRVAVVLGTSTAGLPEGEAARLHFEQHQTWPDAFTYAQQELGNLSAFMAFQLGLTGIAHVISTACSSGAKALASGARLLQAGLADAVIAGGCDVLGAFTVAGFSALESVSSEVCNPMSVNRRGINLGEGAALFLMTREPGPVRLAGWGETSDAHHMSAPDPSGQGAIRAMRIALARAGLPASAIDYLNLHGTATPRNDFMEALAVHEVLGDRVPVSSTKPLTGHTLAAAGALEAAFAWLTLVDNPQGHLPPHWWDGQADTGLPALPLVTPGLQLGRPVRYVMSNSFAFGGSNATLLMGAA
jgi:3-oxoacyl-[acyl-carrier-protein] synthase-1